ncbi:MAG: hypothetical protein PHU70_09575, partial [Dehalococcoidia bacterium]|nr:hypothetical protein [Dehalococcoidia bacterium]
NWIKSTCTNGAVFKVHPLLSNAALRALTLPTDTAGEGAVGAQDTITAIIISKTTIVTVIWGNLTITIYLLPLYFR